VGATLLRLNMHAAMYQHGHEGRLWFLLSSITELKRRHVHFVPQTPAYMIEISSSMANTASGIQRPRAHVKIDHGAAQYFHVVEQIQTSPDKALKATSGVSGFTHIVVNIMLK